MLASYHTLYHSKGGRSSVIPLSMEYLKEYLTDQGWSYRASNKIGNILKLEVIGHFDSYLLRIQGTHRGFLLSFSIPFINVANIQSHVLQYNEFLNKPNYHFSVHHVKEKLFLHCTYKNFALWDSFTPVNKLSTSCQYFFENFPSILEYGVFQCEELVYGNFSETSALDLNFPVQ